MRTYARVEKNVVREILTTDEDIKVLFHPLMQWIDISEVEMQPLEGWIYEDGIFSPPVPLMIF